MSRELLAFKIMGVMVFVTGCIVVGDWRILLGVMFMLAGSDMLTTKEGEPKPQKPEKTWVE